MATEARDVADPGTRPKRWRVRLRWRLAFWAAFVAAALFFYQCYVRRSPGSGPAGPPVPRAEFQRVWTERQAVLLGLGDSITAGYGASEGKSYFGRLLKTFDDESPDLRGVCLSAVIPNITSDNRAVSGSTSLDHLERQMKKLAPHPPDVLGIVVMTTGGNDLIHDYGRSPPREGAMYGATLEQARPWIANYEKRLDLMFDMISAAFPGGCRASISSPR